ncbi:hypothetical protein CC86DRAFT_469667 [Ophiobolus disseminans]|uniref:Uncharacterized protein n=1 Tax=Ophiobolus disseminans TaxID=1469910 RepID=A0A6A6ZQI7_9PLEO|nr:hypothetical protein CC86DRAFT_469667 [Ophiobolus disseminans]
MSSPEVSTSGLCAMCPQQGRPSDKHKRAILFLQDGEQPHFFWLRFSTLEDDEYEYAVGKTNDIPKLAALLGATCASAYNGVTLQVAWNVPLKRSVGKKFDLVGKVLEADSHEAIPAQEVNKSLIKIDGELQDVWYDEVQEHREKLVTGPTVTGARVSNAADINFGCRKPIEIIPVSASQCAAESDFATPICDRIGIPVVLCRLPLSLTGRDRRVNFPGEVMGINTSLRFLNPVLPLIDDGHGIGSAIAVRKDGKPLYQAHMAASVAYGRDFILTRSMALLDCDDNLDMCSKEDFMAWYEDWKEFNGPEGKLDVDVPSPYDV